MSRPHQARRAAPARPAPASTDDYVTISPRGEVKSNRREPFRFIVNGERFELPALDSADVPIALLPVVLAVAGGEVETDEDRVRVAGTFVAFLQDEYPRLWRALRIQAGGGKPTSALGPLLAWVTGLLEAWGAHSGMDPQQPASGR